MPFFWFMHFCFISKIQFICRGQLEVICVNFKILQNCDWKHAECFEYFNIKHSTLKHISVILGVDSVLKNKIFVLAWSMQFNEITELINSSLSEIALFFLPLAQYIYWKLTIELSQWCRGIIYNELFNNRKKGQT